jgi:SH3-like domain-containing protein
VCNLRLTRLAATWHACRMSVSLSVRFVRLLLCGMLVTAPGALAQTPSPQPTTQQPKPKQTPVVRPHGPTHAQKPPGKPPAKPPAKAPAPAPPAPVPVPAPTPAEEPKPPETEVNKGSATGLPLPRFAALRSDEVNLRAGPGTRYPIDWVYKRRDLPVQILREFEVWRLVQDPDGIKGWVHQATLTGRRSLIVTGSDATLRRDPKDNASAVAILKPGVIGRLRSCPAASDWCQVQVGDYRGYLKRGQFWGTLANEVVAG